MVRNFQAKLNHIYKCLHFITFALCPSLPFRPSKGKKKHNICSPLFWTSHNYHFICPVSKHSYSGFTRTWFGLQHVYLLFQENVSIPSLGCKCENRSPNKELIIHSNYFFLYTRKLKCRDVKDDASVYFVTKLRGHVFPNSCTYHTLPIWISPPPTLQKKKPNNTRVLQMSNVSIWKYWNAKNTNVLFIFIK